MTATFYQRSGPAGWGRERLSARAPARRLARIDTPPDVPCSTCQALAPFVPGAARHDDDGSDPLELVLHGDGAASHDHHTGQPGSFDALFSVAGRARAAGRTVLATVPLTRSVYRVVGAIPLLLKARGFGGLRIHVPELRPEAPEALAPRLALALPHALHAIAVARRLGLPAALTGAPLCLLGPHAAERVTSPARTFAPACEGCPARAECPGLDARYLAAYGGRELRPLPAPAPAGQTAGVWGRRLTR